jgi:hypothetical protein
MAYGADMPGLRDTITDCAKRVHNRVDEAGNLRAFVLEAAKGVVRDGSYMHPAFQEGRVQICFSASEALDKQFLASTLLQKVKLDRAHKFQDSGDVVIALLASSTMGISGLPFTMKNAEGKEVKVADGAFTDFLPVIDDFSVKIKPFSDGFNIVSRAPDVAPTEFVPSAYGVYPPDPITLDHLYELGFQDMDGWLKQYLQERVNSKVEQMKKDGSPQPADKTPVKFTCGDDGMVWYDKVCRSVPVQWCDMTASEKTFDDNVAKKPMIEGQLEVLELDHEGTQLTGDRARHQNDANACGGKLQVVLTRTALTWTTPGSTEAAGEIQVPYIEKAEVDKKDPRSVIITSEMGTRIQLKTATPEDANKWFRDIRRAKEEHHNRALSDKHICEDSKGQQQCCEVQ